MSRLADRIHKLIGWLHHHHLVALILFLAIFFAFIMALSVLVVFFLLKKSKTSLPTENSPNQVKPPTNPPPGA